MFSLEEGSEEKTSGQDPDAEEVSEAHLRSWFIVCQEEVQVNSKFNHLRHFLVGRVKLRGSWSYSGMHAAVISTKKSFLTQ